MPLFSKTAECESRGVVIGPVNLQVPVVGWNNSAPVGLPLVSVPPAMSTVPAGSNVAVGPKCAEFIELVGVEVFAYGAYNSALARLPPLFSPPAIRISPLVSKVAVCAARAVIRLPPSDHDSEPGSKTSALAT